MSRQTALRTLISVLFIWSLSHSAIAQESLAPAYVITKAEYIIEVGAKPATSPSKKKIIKYAANTRSAANSEFADDGDPLPTPRSDDKRKATNDTKAHVSATYHVYCLSAKRVEVPLLPPDIAVLSSGVKRPSKGNGFLTDDVRLGRGARGTVALLKGRSSVPHEIVLKFYLAIEREGPRRRITLPLASSSISHIKLDLPEGGLAVKTIPAAPTRTIRANDSTKAEISPSAADSITIEWFPRSLEAPVKPLIFVDASSLIRVSNGVFKRDVTFNYSIPRGADGIDAFAIMLPKKASVLQVKGEGILRWETAPPSKEKFADRVKILKVALESGLRGGKDSQTPKRGEHSPDGRYGGVAYKLRIATEEMTPSAPTTITFTPLKSLNVNRQRGEIALLEEAGLTVKGLSAVCARQLDINALDGATKAHKGETKVAYLYDNYDGLPVEIAIRVEPIKPRVAARVESHARIEAGVITLTSRVSYDIREAGVYQFRIRFDDGLVPLSVEGAKVKDWNFEGHIATARLTSRATGKYTLSIVSQQNIRKINGVTIPRIEALDAESETGYIGVVAGRGVNLQHFSSEKTKQRDTSELPQWIRNMGAKLAYFYDQKGGSLAVSTLEIKPEVSAAIYDFVGVEDDAIKREALIVCDIAKAGKFDFRLGLPPDLVPTAVRGANIEDWTFKETERELWIDLRSEARGEYQFEVAAERRTGGVAQGITLAAIRLEDAKKTEGWLGVGPRANIALRPEAREGLTPLDVGKTPEFFKDYPEMSLAYTFDDGEWRIAFRAIKLHPKIEGETFSLLAFRAGQVTVKTEINYRISEASVNRLWIKLPESERATNVAIAGEGITEKESDENNLWRVSLDRKRKGKYRLDVTWQMPLKGEQFTYQDVKLLRMVPVETAPPEEGTTEGGEDEAKTEQKLKALPITRHVGYIVVEKERPDVEISEISKSGATALDPSQIPAAFSRKVEVPIAAYRYAIASVGVGAASASGGESPTPEIVFRATSHNIAEVVQALAPECTIQTIVKRDGAAISYLSCQLHNTNQQFLEVKLPNGSDLWGTYIAGEPVKPKEDVTDGGRGGKYLIPILDSGKHGSDFSVDIIWRQPVSKPTIAGLGLEAPKFLNLNVDHIDWQVFMPKEYQILGYGGNMKMAGLRPGDVSLVAIIEPFVMYLVPLVVLLVVAALVFAATRLYTKYRGAVGDGVKHRRRRALVYVLVAFAAVIVLAGVLLPTLGRAREQARITNCKSNLRQIGYALAFYANDYDGWYATGRKEPLGSLSLLFDRYISARNVFKCPATKDDPSRLGLDKHSLDESMSSYAYVDNLPITAPPDAIVAYDKGRYNHRGRGRNVLLHDGRVQWLPEGRFQKMLRKQKRLGLGRYMPEPTQAPEKGARSLLARVSRRLGGALPGKGAATEAELPIPEVKSKSLASERRVGEGAVYFVDGHIQMKNGDLQSVFLSESLDKFAPQTDTIGVRRKRASGEWKVPSSGRPPDVKVVAEPLAGAGMMALKEGPWAGGMMAGGQAMGGWPGTQLPPKPPAKSEPPKAERKQREVIVEASPAAAEEAQRAAVELAEKRQRIVESQRKLSAQTHYQLGNERYDKGDYEGAAKEFAKALELDPSLEQARRKRDKAERRRKMASAARSARAAQTETAAGGFTLGKTGRALKSGTEKAGESLEVLDLGVLPLGGRKTTKQAPVKREYDISDLAKDLGDGDIKRGRKKLAQMIQRSFGEALESAKTKGAPARPAKGKRRRARESLAEKEKRPATEELARKEFERPEAAGKATRPKGETRGAAIKGGKLIVADSPEVQAQVASFLKRLRKEQSEIRLAQAKRLREEQYESRRRFAQKQSEMQRLETPKAIAANIIGGKAKGALPILLELPTTGTVAYHFEKPVVGAARPEIRLHCIRRGAALFLQSVIALIVFAGIGASAYKSRKLAVCVIIAASIVLVVMQVLSGSALREYFSVALLAVAISLLALAIHTICRRLLRAT